MMSTQQAPISATPAPFQSASLYVGDLHNEVTEVSVVISLYQVEILLFSTMLEFALRALQ